MVFFSAVEQMSMESGMQGKPIASKNCASGLVCKQYSTTVGASGWLSFYEH